MRKYLKILVPLALLATALTLLVLLYIARPKAQKHEVEEQQASVLVQPVEPVSLRIPVFSRGLVMPDNDVAIVSETSGPITFISPNLVAGGHFQKGEVLLKVNDIETQLKIKRAEAVVAQAKQALAQATAEARSRRSNADSEIVRNYDQQARFQYDAALADLQALQQQLKNAVMVAPFDGRVLSVHPLSLGVYLKPGIPLGQIFSINTAEVRLPLTSEQAALVELPARRSSLSQEGPYTRFFINQGEQRFQWEGMVLGSEGSVDEFNRQLNVFARIQDPFSKDPAQPGRPSLTLGTFVDAEIAGREFDEVYIVPRRAFLNGSQLWVVDANDRLQRRQVEILYKGRNEIYVRDGLNPGERIVLSHLKTAVDGLQVRPHQKEPAPQTAASVTEELQ